MGILTTIPKTRWFFGHHIKHLSYCSIRMKKPLLICVPNFWRLRKYGNIAPKIKVNRNWRRFAYCAFFGIKQKDEMIHFIIKSRLVKSFCRFGKIPLPFYLENQTEKYIFHSEKSQKEDEKVLFVHFTSLDIPTTFFFLFKFVVKKTPKFVHIHCMNWNGHFIYIHWDAMAKWPLKLKKKKERRNGKH